MGGSSQTISQSETKAEAFKLQSSSYGGAVPVGHGRFRVAGNLVDYGDFTAIAHTEVTQTGGKGGGGGVRYENTTYTYTVTAVMMLVEGLVKDVPHVWRGKEKWPYHSAPWAALNTFYLGTPDQPIWAPLLTMAGGTHALNYSGMCFYAAKDYDLGSSVSMENHNFEVIGRGSYDLHAGVPDADPSLIVSDWICDPKLGRGLSSAWLGDLTAYSSYCKAAGLLMSPVLTEQQPAADRIRMLTEMTNSRVVVADGKINVVPLGAEPLSRTIPAAGVSPTTTWTYTPDVTPLFDLGPDQILRTSGEPLIKVTIKSPADVFNVVNVEFEDRDNDYAVAVVSAEDRAYVDLYGENPADTIKCPWIKDAATALRVARLALQRYISVLCEYEFPLPINFAEILPTNILRLTDPDQFIDLVPVRVTAVVESERGFVIHAEDFPAATTAAPVYDLPVITGFRHDYAADPGETQVRAIFEAPYELTETGLEVWASVHGPNDAWGGCHVWVSLDDDNYRKVGTVMGASRSGQVAGAISSGTLNVSSMVGKMLAASAADATLGTTLCYVGGANPEYLSYTTATLTAPGAYSLSGLVRGLYRTSDAFAHSAADPFVRCDEALAKSGAMDLAMIGRTVYLKFPSFNVYGQMQQDLADVDAHAYTITGAYAAPRIDPLNLVEQGSFGILPTGQQPSTWSGGTVGVVTGQPFTKALATTATVRENQPMVMAEPGQQFWVSGYARVNGSSGYAQVTLEFFNAAGASLGNGTFLAGSPTVSSGQGWVYKAGTVEAPAGTSRVVPTFVVGGTTPGVCEIAEFVVRRAASTQQIAVGGATQVLAAAIDSFTVTNTIAEGVSHGRRQLVGEVAVNPSVPCTAVITVTASWYYKNASSGISAGYGGFFEASVHGDPSPSGYVYGGGSAGPGADKAVWGQLAIAGEVGLNGGPATIQFRVGKLAPGDTCELSKINIRVELVLR